MAKIALTCVVMFCAAQDMSSVTIKPTRVAGPIHMLEGRGGNIGVSVGSDGILMIDDQFKPLAEKIRAALTSLSPGKLEFVINTHWHGDHTGGNVVFGADAPIMAHTRVRERMVTGGNIRGREIPPAPPQALPVVTYDDGISIHFNGEEIRIVHYPRSHTDGDSVVFFTKSNVVHMGDLFFAGRFPFVDLDSGGSILGLISSLDKILKNLADDVKIIPGHGPLSTVQDLRAYHAMIIETSAIVRGRIAAGQSLEEIKTAGLHERWASWGTGFISTDAWIECLHRSFTP
jgi:glyoxylase-like metal-dependent hydrolase (beta-lactamase superfamily II)